MKRNVLIQCSAMLALSMALAEAQPVVRVTVSNYGDLGKAINRIASAVNPGSKDDAAQEFGSTLGITNFSTFDSKQPWEIAVWYEGAGGQPLVAIKGPIANINEFKTNLLSDTFLSSQGKEWNQLEHGLGAIIFHETSNLSDTETAELTKWKAAPIASSSRTFEINARLTEPLRTQLKGVLIFGRASAASAASSNPAFAAASANPKAMADIFNAYFDVIDIFADGFNDLKLGVDITPDAIIVEKSLSAKAGTELASWLKTPEYPLVAADLTVLDPQSLFSGAGSIGKSESLIKLVEKFTQAGLRMQNADTNGSLAKSITTLVEKSLPAKIAGTVNFNKQLAFNAAYKFPAGNAADIYSQAKVLINDLLKSQVGEGKMYSAGNLAEKHHTLAGVSVDRLSMTLNLDNPLFKLPGQKEQIEAFYPGGKIELDYAVKDGMLFAATTSGDQMQKLLEGKTGSKSSIQLEKGACAAGYFNLLECIKIIGQNVPMVPDEVKEKLAKLNSQDTSIEYQASLDNQLHSTTKVPMKMLQQLGQLKDAE